MLTYRRSLSDGIVMKEAETEEPTAQRCEVSDSELEAEWQSIDWRSVERHVGGMQTRISKAMAEGRYDDVARLSYLLTHSFDAKALAVRTVARSKGSKTAGVDNVKWEKDCDKMRAVKRLDPVHFEAMPLRRTYIDKKNGKKRPLGIPCIYDRAVQTLYLLALDPIHEAVADPNSYGFRKGRSCQDACEQLFKLLSRRDAPVWILEGDIRGCFDHISHDWLMEHIPMEKRILKEFLDAGYVYQKQLFPTDEGTPQGGPISPTLANLALNGMEGLIKERYPTGVNLVRYADDFVVVAPTREIAEDVKQLLIPFLAERGLELSLEKTLVTHIDQGFDFLSFNFRKYSGKLVIKPSKGAFEHIKSEIREVVLGKGKAKTQDEIIEALNSKLYGWCLYHCKNCAKKTFSALHDYVYHVLYQWAHRRHSRKARPWVLRRYWRKVGENNWVFASDEMVLWSPKEMPIRRHAKVKNGMNPYIDKAYFEERKRNGARRGKRTRKQTLRAITAQEWVDTA